MKLRELLHDTGIKCEDTTENIEITGVSCDSRTVEPGYLFLCLKGEEDDGYRHIEEARQRGAVAVIAPEGLQTATLLAGTFYRFPDRELIMVGVTGTNGKTTTTWLIRQALQTAGIPCGLIGTVSYETGNGHHSADRTTPQPDQMYRLLAEMRDAGMQACSMEVSSHGLALGRVRSLRYDYGLFTNLTEDHLDFHKTMEEYYQAKKQLFYQVEKTAFVNVDDGWGRRLWGELRAEGLRCASVSLEDPQADFFAQIGESNGNGSHLSLFCRGELKAQIFLPLPGKFNCSNGLMAWACAAEICGSGTIAAEALANAEGVPGRFQLVHNSRGKLVIVDYAHTPDALENVLQTARPLVGSGGKLICVFGCGGDRETGKRSVMGRIAGELSDYAIITADNPRTESQEKIAAQIEEGIQLTGASYEIENNRKKAIEKALTLCGDRDMVIIAGKGHEATQTIGKVKYPFDDRKIAEELLKEE